MNDFALTFAQLRAERVNATLWLMVGALALLCAWLCWGLFERVSLYEVSKEARVELDAATYPVDAPFVGRLVASNLHVGQSVRRGDLLIEIDSMPQQLQLREQQIRMQGLDPQISRLRAQIDAERGVRGEEGQGARLSVQEAENRVREADSAASLAGRALERARLV
jgi:multidrug resistance efflux pump